ncbi:MAG: ABC transporter substrate-binding protein [Acidibrevibacterium sp.]|jgi:branched-chain amino acid transport system substrate-binding protein|uniref:ABC transporter substrate-binding protein n=1 Tax=Acidibrevibacterium fodinaquatile TaxID=1969806 RepID=UPI0023A8475E|nr:ABC transporter substrate-binding protein [Acidibrevibacterium fodinaquatile]MCA7120079.1 ABC transporter substrate-binding protein [Acidibrevibacterium fodinaquatile]
MIRTTLSRRALLATGTAALAAPRLVRAEASTPIRIGEINSYSAVPAFTLPYRNGWQLALEHVNAAGGVRGRKLEVISRDDAGKPQDAVRLAGELIESDKVDLLAGGFLSNVGLALSDFSAQKQVIYIAGEPLTDALVWQKGQKFCFRLRPSTYVQAAILVEEAAKLPAKRWVTVAPNYEYGQSAVKWFSDLLKARRPDVEFVAAQWPALGHIDAGAVAEALASAKPDAIYNVTFGPDLTNFVRQGNTRGLFEGRSVVSLLTGEPEYLDPLGEETPPGWIVTGYPWASLDTPAHVAFREAYQKKFNDYPRMGSVVGYSLIQAIAAGIGRAGGMTPDRLAGGFAGATFETPFGAAMFRPLDHQSTLGTFLGKTALKDGKGVMVDWRYVDGASVMPPDTEVQKLRPGAGQ